MDELSPSRVLHPVESGMAVLLDMAPYLAKATLDNLEQASTSLQAAVVALKSDPRYEYVWKQRLEEFLKMSLDADAGPGSTSWKDKCEIVETKGVTGLLLSDEVMDVVLAYSILSESEVDAERAFTVAQAMVGENREVLTFLLQIDHAGALEIIEWILYDNGTVMTVFQLTTGQDASEIFFLSPRCVEILIGLGVKINYPLLFNSVIFGRNIALFNSLLSFPLDFPRHAREYVYTACESANLEALDGLLSLVDVQQELTADFVLQLEMTAEEEYKLDVVDILRSHPVTEQYFNE